jgi:hypothetical protein
VLIWLILSTAPATCLDTFGLTPDKRLAKALAGAADACFQCGEKARGAGLHSMARSYYGHALKYDPDHRNTRRVMGFKKKKKDWVLEKDLIPEHDEIDEARREQLESTLVQQTVPIRQKAADELWKFVEDKNLEREQRVLALFHTLRLFPEHASARRAARTSDTTTGLMHDLDGEADTFRARWIQAAGEGEVIAETTPYEIATANKMQKRRGEWVLFHVHVGDNSSEWARVLTQYTEAARKRSIELLGVKVGKPPEKDEDRLHYSIFATRKSYQSFIEKCSNISDPTTRSDAATKADGSEVYKPYGTAYLHPDTENDYAMRDAIAHDIAVKAVLPSTGWNGYYLLRGMGYLNSVQMNGSITSTFWAVKASGATGTEREALPGLGRCAAGWRLLVATECACGGALDFAQLAALRAPDYGERDMAYSFCLADYLVSQHKERLAKFMTSARTELAARRKDKRELESGAELFERLLTTLELDTESFKSAFAAWVGENYLRLPEGE